ncbi:MAG: PepSY domain-containing protein [Clostridiales bacterium]|nr:PepSY domain-containing protein [Clostridiales bacterium]
MRKLLVGLMCAVMLFASFAPTTTAYAQNQPNSTYEEMRRQIEELRTLINLLITLLQNNNANTGQNQPNQAAIPSISSQRARDIAIELVGHGTARDVILFSDNGVLTFEVEVRHNNVRYMVYVNAIGGGVIRMSRHEDGYQGITTLPEVVPGRATPTPTPQPTPQPTPPPAASGSWSHVVPRSPERSGGPANPPISAQRAVELAHAHILSLGITDYRFDYVYMDLERGTWVWSVEFDSRSHRDLEFYVDVNTGDFLKSPR